MLPIEITSLIARGAKVTIDSRLLEKGDIFFAINNGISFVKQAFEKGASAAVVPLDFSSFDIDNNKLLFVEDPLQFLLETTQKIKNTSKAKIIGITGSAGKTTTKVWLSEILSRFHKVCCGIRNYNTIYGVPVCLSRLKPLDAFGIFEIGSNKNGEIKQLSEFLKPEVGIITTILGAHLEFFESLENIISEKISIIEGLKPGGILIFNGDLDCKEQIIQKANEREIHYLSFGIKETNDFCLKNYEKFFGKNRNHFDLIKISIVATLEALGEDSSKYLKFFQDLQPLPGRGLIQRYKYKYKQFDVIDDSYNASLGAMKAALKILESKTDNSQKIAVLGEMKELGTFSKEFHQELANVVSQMNLDKVFFIGSSISSLPFQEKGMEVFKQLDEICMEKILSFIENEAVVLLKGSRSIGLDKFLNVLQLAL